MPIPWPKILTAVTVPSGGWDIDFNVTDSTKYDTAIEVTIPAGTYYLAWDYQSDCLLYQLELQLLTELSAVMPADQARAKVYLDSSNRVNIQFVGTGYTGTQNQVQLVATTSSSDAIKALGFSASADPEVASDYPTLTADYQHAYGWYAAEDGQLKSLMSEDESITTTPQSVSYSGHVQSQQIGERYINELMLQRLSRDQTRSRRVGYGDTPVHPYSRNKGLECWWREARTGTRFRVYRDGRNRHTNGAIDRGVFPAATGGSGTYTDAARSWAVDPQEHKGLLCETEAGGTTGGNDSIAAPHRFLINSNTDDDLVSANAISVLGYTEADTAYYVLDQRYETYVVDLQQMTSFSPVEQDQLDRYDIEIPLLRYES